jgi:hypothetical protein
MSVAAVALASTAYAVGSTTGHGFATAKTSAQTSASDPWVKTLAGKLGVDPAKLADSLDAVRKEQQPNGNKKDDELTALADALGVPKADLQKALDGLRPQRPARPNGPGDIAAKLAKALGIDQSKVQAALDKLRGNGPGKLDTAALAKELGVTEAKLKDALDKVRPRPPANPPAPGAPPAPGQRGGGGPGFGKGGHGGRERGGPGFGGRRGGISDDLAAGLAKALKLDEQKVKDALAKVSAQRQQEAQTRWDAYVKSLADKLGISVEKVQQGLGSVPPRGFGGPRHP